MRLLLGIIVGPVVGALAGGVLTWRTRRRLPVRTDFLVAPPFSGPLHHFSRDGE